MDRLVEMTADVPKIQVPLSSIRELNESFWHGYEHDQPTCRKIALNAKLIREIDLRFSIILSQDGDVMDGMHKVCKALNEGHEFVLAVQFERDPELDHIAVNPTDLTYQIESAGFVDCLIGVEYSA